MTALIVTGSILTYLMTAGFTWRRFFCHIVDRELAADYEDRLDGWWDRNELDRRGINLWAAPYGLLWPVTVPVTLLSMGIVRTARFLGRPTPTERRRLAAKEAEAAATELANEAKKLGLPTTETITAEIERSVRAKAGELAAASRDLAAKTGTKVPARQVVASSLSADDAYRRCLARGHEMTDARVPEPFESSYGSRAHWTCSCGNEYFGFARNRRTVINLYKKGS